MSSRRSAAGGSAPALQPEVLDAGAGRLADPQPVQRQQGEQGMPGGRPEPGAARIAPNSLRSSAVACDS